jgi:hypothetical protein
MWKFIKTHKPETVIASICLLMFIFALIFIKIFFLADAGDNYGSRLEDIKNIKISGDKLDKIKAELKNESGIVDVETNIEGRIINVLITVGASENLDNMKSKSVIILDNLNDKEEALYDIQIYLITKEDSSTYPDIGYQSKGSDNIVWVR